jgi:hypothetical protein
MILELRLFLSLDWTTLSHVPAPVLLAPFRVGPRIFFRPEQVRL